MPPSRVLVLCRRYNGEINGARLLSNGTVDLNLTFGDIKIIVDEIEPHPPQIASPQADCDVDGDPTNHLQKRPPLHLSLTPVEAIKREQLVRTVESILWGMHGIDSGRQ
ncbi:hypothetical protein FGSG_12674 [Fusarium graminearum PH-1]|uniref:hypothetical protein n=1 Tax=Gibberella zeae (strain ATCC MYA-4620 / CBS 123657 / FGSC 9075 / NRRL 31084 / PH-1) TaxID=229533 RepID=UPI00021F1C0D|nr:hypothetical protein FGSG_12674 [Fusarium graminearum PH-1]ESU10977.1 hypothetical protein FGSG_12674 [Fusarium graminearum PH-1]|eukprot:XP_011323553.1 hypothetical protein FGSG_12674 [Fusarium graminearum PH-1]